MHPFGSTKFEDSEHLGPKHRLGPVIVCYDQEPLIPGYNDELFDQIRKLMAGPRIFILASTEKNSAAKQYFLDKYKFKDAYSFFHVFAAHDWYRGNAYSSVPSVKDRTINKKFITFNRLTSDARCYRSLFVANLADKNLLEQGHISYSQVCPHNNLSYRENLNYALRYGVSTAEIDYAVKMLDTISTPLRIDSSDGFIPNGSMNLHPIRQNLESFLHVVTETCFWDNKEHLTEKIFKPVLLKQPFVLMGCANNLAYLKSYGFKTFDKWWDESYDTIENPVERIRAVVSIIESICNKSNNELEALLLDMEDTLNYNYNLFNSKEFLDSVWNELSTNLITALTT